MTRPSQWTDHIRDLLDQASDQQVRAYTDRLLSLIGQVADEGPRTPVSDVIDEAAALTTEILNDPEGA
ncbi:hypothetical protein EII34_14945 [Arachnia propionica]|uniref:Uncharacterized protein n=1 Tax=Arachnia propionica TaxID=1750 RepID=A0A3P1T106_9ACTN|nr:hypothetical protein [Arachnia propionica]RRD03202.1 hypothetical protein EII34_14945 [Arachnia propionica]